MRVCNLFEFLPDYSTINHIWYYKNFQEGLFLMEHGKDPYSVPGMYQKPIFLYAVKYLWNLEFMGLSAFFVLNLFMTAIFAHLFTSIISSTPKARVFTYALTLINPVVVSPNYHPRSSKDSNFILVELRLQ